MSRGFSVHERERLMIEPIIVGTQKFYDMFAALWDKHKGKIIIVAIVAVIYMMGIIK